MQLLTEMDLPLLQAELPEFSANPVPFVEQARRQHPWLARSNVGGFIVHGYQPAKDIIAMDDNTHPFYPGLAKYYDAEDTPWGRFISGMMNATVGDTHRRLRMSVQTAFMPKNINRYRELIRKVISELLDDWAPRGEFDFADFASNFPITVFCGLLGVSSDVVPRIRDALETQGSSVSLNRELRGALMDAYEVLWDFVDTAVHEREKAGEPYGHGLIDTMLAAKAAGKLDDTEIRHNLIMFAAGGYDTSKNMLGVITWLLLDRPDLWERCAQDIAFCRKVTDEALRHSGIPTVYRSVVQDFEYDGVRFPKGTMLILMMGMAGRDPAAFPDPDRFDPERGNSGQHVSFGRGEHHCIGMHLARAQIEEGLQLVAQRLRKPQLAGEVGWRPYLGTWGVRSLPIRFEPAPAPGELEPA